MPNSSPEATSPGFILSLFTALGTFGATLLAGFSFIVRLKARVDSHAQSLERIEKKVDLLIEHLLNRA